MPGCRIEFREINEHDAYSVCMWRNSPDARQSFFRTDIVTPDTHRAFIRNRKPHDLVWMIELRGEGFPIGMTSLTVDTLHSSGEYGRAYIDQSWRGQGYAKEQEFFLLYLAFEFFRLDNLWLDAYQANQAIISLHYKTGWLDGGLDLPGHTDPRGPVLNMTYTRSHWATNRSLFSKAFPRVELPEWVE